MKLAGFIIFWNETSGTIDLISSGRNLQFRADSPEDLMKFVRFIRSNQQISKNPPTPPPTPLPTLTNEELNSHPSYQKFIYPSSPHGIKHSRRISREEYLEALEEFDLKKILEES